MRKLFAISLFFILSVGVARSASENEYATDLAYELSRDNFIEARKLVDSIFAINPESYIGYYGLGVVYRKGESNLAKSYYYLKKSLQIVDNLPSFQRDRYDNYELPIDSWLPLLLFELGETAGELDLYKEKLDYYRRYDRSYSPKLTAWYGWPLMKLGKIDEARKLMKKVIDESEYFDDRVTAINTLGAMEYELDNREASYDIFSDLVYQLRYRRGDYVAIRRNLGESAMCLLKFDEAEKYFIEASQGSGSASQTSNPWADLLYLYIGEARFEEAYDAARKMIFWGLERDPHMDQQSKSEEDLFLAMFLLASGYAKQSLNITSQLVAQPDRTGYTSRRKDQSRGGALLMNFLSIKVYLRMLEAEVAVTGFFEGMPIRKEIFDLRAELETTRSKLRSLMIKNNSFKYSLIPFHPRAVLSPNYLAFELSEVMGSGITAAELEELKSSYRYKDLLAPYFDLFEAELAFTNNKADKAYDIILEKALPNLPEAEKLLRARAYLTLAQIAESRGMQTDATDLYASAFEIFPALFLIRGVPVPVKLMASDSREGQILSHKIRKIDLFDVGRTGVTLEINYGSDQVSGRMLDGYGNMIFETKVKTKDDVDETIREFVGALIVKAFVSPMSADFADINSLDGSTLKSEKNVENLKDFFFK